MDTDNLFAELVEALDRDIHLIEMIRYRLIVLEALAGTNEGALLPRAVTELGTAHEELAAADRARAAATARVAERLDLDPDSRVEALAERADEGWGEILRTRRRALIEALSSAQGLARTVSGAMGRRASLVEEALASLRPGGGTTYGRGAQREPMLVEGAM